MPPDLLVELKKLQHQRSESSPFADHIEFQTWADKALPLLSFDPKLHALFRNSVASVACARSLNIAGDELSNINNAIGIVNQAITSLEIAPVPDSPPKPADNNTATKFNPSKFKQWLFKVGEKIFIALIVGAIGYVFLHYVLPITA